MAGPRLIGILLLIFGIFMTPEATVHACTMHRGTIAAAQENKDNPHRDCCKHNNQASKHQPKKGNCDDNNCTNNNCHPMSVSSLHVMHTIEVAPPVTLVATHVVKPNDHPLTSHTCTIWQPPRQG